MDTWNMGPLGRVRVTDSSVTITNPNRRMFALLTLKARLNIEIMTGLKHSYGSTINVARAWGYTGVTRKKACLEWVLNEISEEEQAFINEVD